MCLAIVAKKGFNIDSLVKSIDNAWEDNPHGGGYSFADNGTMLIGKGYKEKAQFIDAIIKATSRGIYSDMLIHLRYASAGNMDASNCHPFEVGKTASLIHNGTIRKFTIKGEKKSDTCVFSEYLSKVFSKYGEKFVDNKAFKLLVEDIIGSDRVAILTSDGKATILNEHKWTPVVEGDSTIVYSNDYYKEDVKRVTTYAQTLTTSQTSLPLGYGNTCVYCKSQLNYSMEKKNRICFKCEGY